MTFLECVQACAGVPSFVAEYDRITGSRLTEMATAAPIDQMVDKATGRKRDEVAKFAAFVYEFVWTRMPRGPA